MTSNIQWSRNGFGLDFSWGDNSPVVITALHIGGVRHSVYAVPVVELLTSDHGHRPASDRLAHTDLGGLLRYVSHAITELEQTTQLVLDLAGPGVAASLTLVRHTPSATVRASVRVTNNGEEPVVLRAVASWSAGFTPLEPTDDTLSDWTLVSGASDWLGEGRWTRRSLREQLPQLEEHLTGHNPRGALSTVSTGTWSTGKVLPNAVLESASLQLALAWQVEHNGAWRWEIGEDTDGAYLALSGPTEIDSSFTRELAPGESFDAVPVTVTAGRNFESVLANLTGYRRFARHQAADNAALPVIFNDYMNTLNGDPTTDKLLPLIGAAAEVGAEIFCIDAGWYDDSGYWWDSVGEWKPSTTRFPGGLGLVIDAIRDAGMVPGLWLEPEVVGVRSPLADALPNEAFLMRRGRRIVEHDRYHLDLRHPLVIDHLNGVIDRLVEQFGVGFFKLDYNINPGAGTDHDAHSLGDGLLQHNRAHLAWLDSVLERHPTLVIENCSSGAMRSDFAMMSRLAMQSTSDQQDFTLFPPIAVTAPLMMLPEQAANWAYPQPEMSLEEASFCLITGLLGRYYLSGYLNKMSDQSRALVAEAVATAKTVRGEITRGVPSWPLGLPGWNDDWVSLALGTETSALVSLWSRRATERVVKLDFPQFVGREISISTVFPLHLEPWATTWDSGTGSLTVRAGAEPLSARTLRLEVITR